MAPLRVLVLIQVGVASLSETFDLNLTPCELQTLSAFGTSCFVAIIRNARGSNFACLAGKRAFRLVFAALSAPSFALRTSVRRRANSFFCAQKKKNTEHPNGYSVFLAERVVRKLNIASPAPIDLELVEFNPPDIKLLDKWGFNDLLANNHNFDTRL